MLAGALSAGHSAGGGGVWPEPKAVVVDRERGVDKELGRVGGGGVERREGEVKDGAPWPLPHWTTERREEVKLELRVTGREEKIEREGATLVHAQHK